jgi:hypothetical protein
MLTPTLLPALSVALDHPLDREKSQNAAVGNHVLRFVAFSYDYSGRNRAEA